MSIDTETARLIGLFQLPFMQRALLGSVLSGLLGGLLGSFAILRQLSVFSDALGHSALLGHYFRDLAEHRSRLSSAAVRCAVWSGGDLSA